MSQADDHTNTLAVLSKRLEGDLNRCILELGIPLLLSVNLTNVKNISCKEFKVRANDDGSLSIEVVGSSAKIPNGPGPFPKADQMQLVNNIQSGAHKEIIVNRMQKLAAVAEEGQEYMLNVGDPRETAANIVAYLDGEGIDSARFDQQAHLSQLYDMINHLDHLPCAPADAKDAIESLNRWYPFIGTEAVRGRFNRMVKNFVFVEIYRSYKGLKSFLEVSTMNQNAMEEIESDARLRRLASKWTVDDLEGQDQYSAVRMFVKRIFTELSKRKFAEVRSLYQLAEAVGKHVLYSPSLTEYVAKSSRKGSHWPTLIYNFTQTPGTTNRPKQLPFIQYNPEWQARTSGSLPKSGRSPPNARASTNPISVPSSATSGNGDNTSKSALSPEASSSQADKNNSPDERYEKREADGTINSRDGQDQLLEDDPAFAPPAGRHSISGDNDVEVASASHSGGKSKSGDEQDQNVSAAVETNGDAADKDHKGTAGQRRVSSFA